MEIKHAGSYNQGPTWPRGTNNIIKKQLSIQLIDAMQIGAMRKQKTPMHVFGLKHKFRRGLWQSRLILRFGEEAPGDQNNHQCEVSPMPW